MVRFWIWFLHRRSPSTSSFPFVCNRQLEWSSSHFEITYSCCPSSMGWSHFWDMPSTACSNTLWRHVDHWWSYVRWAARGWASKCPWTYGYTSAGSRFASLSVEWPPLLRWWFQFWKWSWSLPSFGRRRLQRHPRHCLWKVGPADPKHM